MIPLNKIIGQDTAKKIILNSYGQNRISSTYLFYGREGTGKWLMAINLAALMNCEVPLKDNEGIAISACGQCLNCRQIFNLTFPELYFGLPLPPHRKEEDMIELQNEFLTAKKGEPYKIIRSDRPLTIPINTARDIIKRTFMKPPEGITRIILFYQMEKMLTASADSLLKLIEEPPPETIIILTATDQENLLPTIQSRAQKIRFNPINEEEISRYLIEKYELPEKQGANMARIAEGSLGQAIELASDEEETTFRQLSLLMFKALFQKDNPSAVAIVNEFINPRNLGEFEKILAIWQSYLSDLISLKYEGDQGKIINVDLAVELSKLSSYIPPVGQLQKMIDEIKLVVRSLSRNIHIRPAISSLVLQLRGYINNQSA